MKKLKKYQKVFGLGLSRTGTTSLGEALNMLGIKTIHYPNDEKIYDDLTKGNYRLRILETFQGIVDIPAAPYYAQFDNIYPDSKFILTVRDKDFWLKSMKNNWSHFLKWGDPYPQYKKFTLFIFTRVYGSLEFNEDRLGYVYDAHSKNVCDYFKDRPDDFLIMDISGGDGWEKLCPFLGFPTPKDPFPYTNKSVDRLLPIRDISAVIGADDTFILVDHAVLRGTFTSDRPRAIPFLERDGKYWGLPPDDNTAIQELERLRQSGANFIVFAWPAFWWLDYYAEFLQYLRSNSPCMVENDRLVVFDLRA
jgi:hypothetical protein